MTTTSSWAIRFYVPIYDTTISFISSYDGYGGRSEDKVLTFSGMYGINDYMLWYTHKDLKDYNFDKYGMNLRLFLHGNPRAPYFDEKYRVSNVWYDDEKDKYVIYAIQEDHIRLDTLLVEYGVTSLSYSENRDVEKVLRDVLEENGIFPVEFHEIDDHEYRSRKFEYRRLTIKPDWTVRDFIEYIAGENSFEWCLKYGALHIGPELKALSELNATKEIISEADNLSKSQMCMKENFNASPLDVLYHWDEQYRCIWCKHIVGVDGDTTRGCFAPIARGRYSLNRYVETLEGELERTIGRETSSRLGSSFSINFKTVMVGRIRDDSGEDSYVDETSVHKDLDNIEIKDPKDMVIDVEEPLQLLERLSRTTPYLEDGAGLLFPSPEDPANSIIFLPEGRIESAVVGPFVFGNGDNAFVIPKKNPEDFRLQLTNGWCLHVNEDGDTIIQTDGMDAESIPSEDTSKTHIKLNKNGTIDINTNNKNVTINQGTNQVSLIGHTHGMNNHTHTIPQTHTHLGNLGAPTGPPINPYSTNTPNPSSTQGESDKHSKNFKTEQA